LAIPLHIFFMLAILVHALCVSALEILQTSLGIHPKPKTSFCDYLFDYNPNWVWMIFQQIFWRFSSKIWRHITYGGTHKCNKIMRVSTCRMPGRFQKIYKGIQGFCTSLAAIGFLTFMLEDEQSFKHGEDCNSEYYDA
jgi:hypothetical protein